MPACPGRGPPARTGFRASCSLPRFPAKPQRLRTRCCCISAATLRMAFRGEPQLHA